MMTLHVYASLRTGAVGCQSCFPGAIEAKQAGCPEFGIQESLGEEDGSFSYFELLPQRPVTSPMSTPIMHYLHEWTAARSPEQS